MRTLIIDNYDSYTFNLYQMIGEVNGESPVVIANDQIKWDEISKMSFDNIVISPGPGRPENSADFGVCQQIIKNIKIPLLGVCLGHQGIGYLHGARVIHAPEVQHGRLSKIFHNGSQLFTDIPQQFSVVRYHSLIIADDLPNCLEKIAWTETGLIMALRHRYLPFWGVQFHPESICTEYGQKLLENFRNITLNFIQHHCKITRQQYFTGYNNKKSYSHHYSKQSQDFQVYTRKLNVYHDTEKIFVQIFGDAPNSFWLDSSLVESGLSRFSFMGDGSGPHSLLIRYYTKTQKLTITQSDTVVCRHESIFTYLNREIEYRRCYTDELPFDFNCGFVGYFGYELKAECGSQLVNFSPLPDAIFLFADRFIAIDHQEHCIYLLQLIKIGEPSSPGTWFDNIEQQLTNLDPLPKIVHQENKQSINLSLHRPYQTYIQDIDHCLQQIYEGETYQVCLTNQLHSYHTLDPLGFYRNLRHINPAPYSAFLRFGEIAIACSSPERFLKINPEKWVETKPIKGTIPRGKTPSEDVILRTQLYHSDKDRAENLMIVDLLRNDLGRVCELGSVTVPKLMDVETYATVHQLVTTVKGKLRPDLTTIDCIQSCFPGGSMTGAPKLRTMQIIDRLEKEARGVYSGAIGFLALNGSTDLNIVIRTAVLTPEHISIGIGGGVIALSDPKMEFQETLLKAKALIQALVITIEGNSEVDIYSMLGLQTTNDLNYEQLSTLY
ncbi:aminodeoxychorismate synthase component I [Anabaena sp. FACHB-1237]|uniref:aminodeoxychorismate synthase component I n=1 Tax=Anabaena sp. FACHB-1237 TaxID=2692769 RepID=UPI0016807040|nr:aminodeoxychorismate synthase component I [Anabaena sp. FACHB-1237]MBD2138840.1 aminodeoxychorismate synthase component I [Anabaena sp. FACHB-1237]